MAEKLQLDDVADATPGASGADRQAILDDLRRQVAELSDGRLEPAEVDVQGHLLDHGYLDSLSAVMFIAHIEERYGVALDDVEFVESLNSIEAIAARIAAR